MQLDAIDRRLLALLQSDGRIAYQDLGDAVGLSGPAAFQRVRKLESSGVIAGYHAQVSPERVNRGLLVFVRVAPGAATRVPQLVKRWFAVDEIMECHRLLSDGAFLLKLRLPHVEHVRRHLDAARGAGCSVNADVALESEFERWSLPVG